MYFFIIKTLDKTIKQYYNKCKDKTKEGETMQDKIEIIKAYRKYYSDCQNFIKAFPETAETVKKQIEFTRKEILNTGITEKELEL